MIRICLSMIVRNESARIERMLASVAPHIHSIAINDTGSTDNTVELIRDFMGAHNIPGGFKLDDWVNFAHNRNLALDHARMFLWDYLLLCDADMELVAPDGFGDLTAPGYRMLQRSGDLEYWNARLLRDGVGARYRCATHEYLEVDEPLEDLRGAHFIDHADGANRPGKIERDIAMLKAELAENPDYDRAWFYLAQSYRDAGRYDEAIAAYERRAELGGWNEEVFYAWLGASRAARGGGIKSATELALQAFDARPSRPEPLADLSSHFRERGQNETAAMIAIRGLKIPQSQDALFVETGAHERLASDLSICGFYSVDPEIRKLGHDTCDRLALDRAVSQTTRDTARQNLHFYLQPIADVFPSWQARRLDFSPPDGYLPMCPSVTRHGDRIMAAQRTVNYKIDERGYVRIADDLPLTAGGKIHTRTFLIEIDPDTFTHSVHGEILLPPDLPAPVYDVITGFEDMRLFEWQGALWGISTVLDQNPDARAEQWLARIGLDLRMCEARPIYPDGPRQPREKNWMPLVDGTLLRFIYRSDPTLTIDDEGHTVSRTIPDSAADHLSGSSQAIPFAGGWLAVVHWRQWFDGWPKYRHRFAWYGYDAGYRLQKVSPGWVFPSSAELDLLNGYQYVTGLCWHPDGERLVMGFQVAEREAWVGTLDAVDIARALGVENPGTAHRATPRSLEPAGDPPAGSFLPFDDLLSVGEVRDRLGLPATKEEITGLEPTMRSGGSFLHFDDSRWVSSQTNRPLMSKSAVGRASRTLDDFGLPHHRDLIKDWDTYLALHHIVEHCHPKEPILDAGGHRDSAFLPALAKIGYKTLLSLNLDEVEPGTEDGVQYRRGDITATDLPDKSYRFIACLSVLEHGVNVRKFLDEAYRVLTPGGHLFVSIDFWEVPVSTDHVQFVGSYTGQRWNIFTPSDLQDMIRYSQGIGFRVVGNVDFRCRDPVADWLGCKYTFFNLLFQR